MYGNDSEMGVPLSRHAVLAGKKVLADSIICPPAQGTGYTALLYYLVSLMNYVELVYTHLHLSFVTY